jgi:hypothetical protein
MSVHAPATPIAAVWLDDALARLGEGAGRGVAYLKDGPPAAEPTALAALALARHGRMAQAGQAAHWLAHQQAADGSLAVRPGETTPAWPTSLALVVWNALNQDRGYDAAIAKGAAWLLKTKGTPTEKTSDVGHDTQLIGWSWADNTHSWLEPTAFAVLALRALGKQDHSRAREAVRLMGNRLLDSGGCNYGNTTVFGRELRAHVEPTGVVLLALAGSEPNAKVQKAMAWLESQLHTQTPAASLGWGLLGLRARAVVPAEANAWLATAARRVQNRDQSPAKLALLALAAVGWPSSVRSKA